MKYAHPIGSCLSLTLLVLTPACGGGEEPSDGAPTRAAIENLFKVAPIAPRVDNPITPEKIALGNTLYHDTRMSAGNNISCASCHDLAKWGTDNKPTSPGSGGELGGRNSPSSVNAFRQFAQFWDGRAATVEEQALGPILNPIEHGLTTEDEVVTILKADPELVAAFAAAFPGQDDPVTFENVGLAIGAFERTLVTESPFDRWLAGDDAALTEEQRRGLDLFVQTGCTTCHSGKILGGNQYKKLGDVHAYETADLGRFDVTQGEADKYLFKVPSLLNVEKTGPYFHDGSVETLEECVELMAWHQLDKKLEAADSASIVAFLKAQTGPLEL